MVLSTQRQSYFISDVCRPKNGTQVFPSQPSTALHPPPKTPARKAGSHYPIWGLNPTPPRSKKPKNHLAQYPLIPRWLWGLTWPGPACASWGPGQRWGWWPAWGGHAGSGPPAGWPPPPSCTCPPAAPWPAPPRPSGPPPTPHWGPAPPPARTSCSPAAGRGSRWSVETVRPWTLQGVWGQANPLQRMQW